MNYGKIRQLNEKLFFTVEDIARVFSLNRESARVLGSRYRKKGIFIRIKNNFYVSEAAWARYEREDFFRIANFLQVPSYISFVSALSYYGVTTQVPRDYYESASVKRSREFAAGGIVFAFRKIKREYYSGFEKRNGLFIATPEKALLDSLYLSSFGKYPLDKDALDPGKLDRGKIRKLLEPYPAKTQKEVQRLCAI